MRVLATGRGLVESPRWHDGRVYYSDWTAGEILVDGDDVVVSHGSLPLCFDFLPDGRLVLVSNQAHALLTADLEPYADLSALSSYGHNDIVADARGNAYVNSGNFDFAAGPPPGDVQPGYVALVRPDGSAEIVADDLAFPNGMGVSPDGSTLVVADSYRHQLVGFDIAADGTLSGRRVWADLGDDNPDGLCLDVENACWYADVPHQVCRRVAEGGEILQTIELDRGGFACVLGGTTLYVTAARWPGFQHLATFTEWDGQLQAFDVDVPGR